MDWLNSNQVCVDTLAGFGVMLVAGIVAGWFKLVSISRLHAVGRYTTDPFSIWLHEKMKPGKQTCLQQGRWLRFFLLVWFNNLVLAGLIGRVVYGIIFFVPFLLVLKTGFAQGVVIGRLRKPPHFLLLLEFGGYILAAVLGTHLGYHLWQWVIFHHAWSYVFPIKIAITAASLITLGAVLETVVLKNAANYFDFSKIDMQKQREALLKQLERES